MTAQAIQLPHARDVGGDLFEAAKPLLLLGWSEPAILTARVALERLLRGHAESTGLDASSERYFGVGRLSHHLKVEGVFDEYLHRDTVSLNDMLSQAAHGMPVKLYEAVRLVERTQKRMRKIDKIVNRHFAR